MNVLHHVHQPAIADVALHHNPPTDLLALERVRPAGLVDSCDRGKRCRATAWQVDGQAPQSVQDFSNRQFSRYAIGKSYAEVAATPDFQEDTLGRVKMYGQPIG